MGTQEQIQPAVLPPAGMSSNFIDPLNMGPNLVACNIVLLVVAVLVVAARIVSRTVLTDWRLGWDDYTMVLALIGTVIFSSFVMTTTHYGLGKHMWDVPMSTYSPHYLWWIMATFAACPASYFFVKISILFFYLRVFQLQARLRYIIYALFFYCFVYYWVAFFTIVGLCNAENRSWNITATMNCFAYGKLTFAIGAMDLVADVLVLAFPVPMVLKLQISRSQKVYLLFVFLAGISASVACAIRLALGVQARGMEDATMAQYRIVTTFCIEHFLALIAGCMPTLGPFFRYLRPSQWRLTTNGHKNLADNPSDGVDSPYRTWARVTRRQFPDHSLLQGSINVSQTFEIHSTCADDVPSPKNSKTGLHVMESSRAVEPEDLEMQAPTPRK